MTASCLIFFPARESHRLTGAMRDNEDPKPPHPTRPPKKGANALEASEGLPRHVKDADRDRHRHV